MLPAQVPVCAVARQYSLAQSAAVSSSAWSFGGPGVAKIRLNAARVLSAVEVLNGVRAELEQLDGTLVVQQCPIAVKEALDVWGALKDALPLMQQIKGKFDPARTLNPGRFVGAI